MALTKYALCSRALIKLGCASISGFDDGTAESDVAGSLYDSTRDALLSAHPWSFATGQVTLPRLTATPVADFDFAYQLPSDFLRALSVGNGDSGRGRGAVYRIQERRIHTDVEPLVLTYIFRPDEVNFPPFFDQALIVRLAAEFCLPLTENTSRAELMANLAEQEFRRAKLVDGQQQTPQSFEDFTLINCRR